MQWHGYDSDIKFAAVKISKEPTVVYSSNSCKLCPLIYYLPFSTDQSSSLAYTVAMVQQLHGFFFPLMAQGHILPTLDMAKVFSSRGVKATLITTHQHVPTFEKAIERSRKDLGFDISIRGIKFPASEVGLPEGTENLNQMKSEDLIDKFVKATAMLQDQLEQLLEECRPHFLIADMFFPWATDAAAKFGIPRLVFYGSSTFATSAQESLCRHRPHDSASSDSEPFVVPDLPHEIKLTRGQIRILDRQRDETESSKLFQAMRDMDLTSYGVIVNSFYEREPDYVDYYTKKLGRRAWHIGLLSLCNNEVEDIIRTGKQSDIDEHECLEWLDSKKLNSVVYICFGSLCSFTAAQLNDIANGLEASGQDFIWVVRDCFDEEDSKKWFPQGFEERTKGKGLIVKGWAPQLLILGHAAVGAFVTHCGWNSTLEGVCFGVPMVTCPLFAEQFLNEKLVTDVLRIGIGVGAQQWSLITTNAVKGEALAKAVERIMVGDEAVEIRGRCKTLKEMARRAIEEGGSSYSDFNALIQELTAYHSEREQ